MRPIAFHIVFFVWIFSACAWLTDVMIFDGQIAPYTLTGQVLDTSGLLLGDDAQTIRNIGDATLNPSNADGILERVAQYTETGYFSAWVLLEVLSGDYLFTTLAALGLPEAFRTFLTFLFPMFVGFNVIYLLVGRN